MSAGRETGVGGALKPAIEEELAAAPAVEEGEQLDLLGARSVLGELVRLQDGSTMKRDGPGRPPGARNKRTQDWVNFILGRHRSPLVGLAEIVSTPIPVLAKTLGMKTVDAAEFWRKCAAELAPYLHQRQAIAVDVQGATAGMLNVFIGTAPAGDQARSAFALDLQPSRDEDEQDQGLSGEAAAQSDGEQSDGGAK